MGLTGCEAVHIAMHIAALKPAGINPEDLSDEFIAKEKEILKEQLVAEGKPEQIIEKIMAGKVEKLYSEVCLMKQKFIKNDKKTIDDLLKDIANGDKYMKVYKQMKMYNDDELNPVLRGQK